MLFLRNYIKENYKKYKGDDATPAVQGAQPQPVIKPAEATEPTPV